MRLNVGLKNLFWKVFAVVFIIVFAVWFILNPAPKHIEDTNGESNYQLQTITKQDVLKLGMGSRGGINEKKTSMSFFGINASDGIRYSSKKFTGVYELYNCQLFKGSDINIDLYDFNIHSGNFQFYVIFDDEIVGTIKPGENSNFVLDNVEKTATLKYVIAGESANFEFSTITEW